MKINYALLLTFFSISIVTAQNGTVTAGGDALGVGGSSSYTIGQVLYMRPQVPPPPTGQGVIDKQTLISQGCAVLTD